MYINIFKNKINYIPYKIHKYFNFEFALNVFDKHFEQLLTT